MTSFIVFFSTEWIALFWTFVPTICASVANEITLHQRANISTCVCVSSLVNSCQMQMLNYIGGKLACISRVNSTAEARLDLKVKKISHNCFLKKWASMWYSSFILNPHYCFQLFMIWRKKHLFHSHRPSLWVLSCSLLSAIYLSHLSDRGRIWGKEKAQNELQNKMERVMYCCWQKTLGQEIRKSHLLQTATQHFLT